MASSKSTCFSLMGLLLLGVMLSSAAAAASEFVVAAASESVSDSGSPCIECKDCITDHCFSMCQKSCLQPLVNGEQCKALGEIVGTKAAAQACSSSLMYCHAGKPYSANKAAATAFPVTLDQCGNIAFGTCQQAAMGAGSPCAFAFPLGYEGCDGSAFLSFYSQEVKDFCMQELKSFIKH